jgi:hypothetical protein
MRVDGTLIRTNEKAYAPVRGTSMVYDAVLCTGAYSLT